MRSDIKRVLIADNHELIRRGVRMMLEARSAPHIVVEAANGRSALAEARVFRPHVAIVDYALPELNGLDLIPALKREVPDVQVLIFTMLEREDLILDALRAGAKGYVRKSDSVDQLSAGVDALYANRSYVSCDIPADILKQAQETRHVERGVLTNREREILQLIAEGRINKQIGHILAISVKTVETHRAAMMHKISCGNTAQLVRYALRNNIVAA